MDCIKIDIEGAEVQAIAGMRGLVGRNPQLRLVVEFNPVTMGAAKVSPEQFFEVLRGAGFDCFIVINTGRRLHIPEDLPWLTEHAANGGDNVNILCERV